MKILHIVEASFAGVGRHVLDLAAGQSAGGHQVSIVYSGVREGEGFAAQRKRMVSVSFIEIGMTRTAGLSDLVAFARIARLVARFRPDIIHGHSTKGGLLARMAPTLFCGDLGSLRSTVARVYTPNAVYSMNPGLSNRTRRAVGIVERLLSYRTDLIIAVSPEEKRHLNKIGVDQDRVVVVPNGIPLEGQPDRNLVRTELGLPLEATIIGFVGRLDDQKNPSLLIEAFAQIADEVDDLVLSVVGTGPLALHVKSQVSALGLENRVWLHGEQPGRRAMASFDLFVLPSRYEGFPYVLIEAAQAGLPIVTTSGACAEQLNIEGRYGRVVTLSSGRDANDSGKTVNGGHGANDQDASDLGRAILHTLNTASSGETRRLAAQSGAQFTVEAMVAAVEELFTQRIEPAFNTAAARNSRR